LTTTLGSWPSSTRSRQSTKSLYPCRPHLIEEPKTDLERAATQSTFTNSLKLLRHARERLGEGLRAVEADTIAVSDDMSLRIEQRMVSLHDERPRGGD
jgi:hypothetical protein